MNIAALPVSALLLSSFWLFSPLPQSTLPTDSTPPRTSFIVAAESTIDEATSLDMKAADPQFRPQMQALTSAENNLTRMAEEDSERDIAAAVKDLVFTVSACHIQAKGGASTAQCESQVNSALNTAMKALNKHKSGGAWQDGPPA